MSRLTSASLQANHSMRKSEGFNRKAVRERNRERERGIARDQIEGCERAGKGDIERGREK